MQPLQPGTLVALPERFAGTTLLGQGGMGLVYRARDQALDRDVVIKTLHESLSRDEGVRARFLDEARAMAALSHPNIVSVHDVHTGHPSYFIMEHIDGECLRDILDREQTLDEGRALATGLALADALAHAHDQGLIHRDVKPENVMVSNRGRVVLLDFGLVKVLEGAARTSPQHVMGTLGYMSPEQLQAEPVDARSDVYSLGVMLYEMVSGISPSRMTSMRNPLFRPPVPPPDLPGVSTELAAVIDRAMSFHRENRHAGAQEMCEALRGAHRRWLEIEGKRSGERLLRALVKLEHMQDELVLPLRDQLALPGGESVLSQANQPARLRSIATRAGDLSDRISDLESDVLEISETVRRLDASRTIIARIAQGAAGRGFARPRDVARAHAIFRELAAHLDLVIGTYKVDVVAVARDAIGSAVTVDGDESTIVMTMADPESFQADLRQLLQGLAEELVGPGEPPPGIRLRRGSGEVCIDVEWRPPASAEAATRIAGQARGITQLRQLAARHGGVIEEGPPDDTRSFTIRIPE